MAAKRIEFDDHPFRELKAKFDKLSGLSVRVGVLADDGSKMVDGEGGDDPISMVELAAIHEFGAPRANVPERSFIRSTIAAKREEIDQLLGRLGKAIIHGKMDPRRAYNQLGLWLVAQIKNTIAGGPHIPPPLKPATIKRKGSDRPLVDTGGLLNAISHIVDGSTPAEGGGS